MHLKKRKRNKKSVYSYLTLSLRQKEEKGAKGGGGEEEKKRQSFPLSLPLSDDASLRDTCKKPSSLGRAGIQTVVHFIGIKLK